MLKSSTLACSVVWWLYSFTLLNPISYKSLNKELPLRGLLSCSNCGEKLTGSGSRSATGNRYFYYHCNLIYNNPNYKI